MSDKRIQAFWNAQAEWSQSAFGSDYERGPQGPLKHLEKEAREAQQKDTDVFEYADCLFLIFDAARRAGFSLDFLLTACEQKLEINKARKWERPTSDEPVEHVRQRRDVCVVCHIEPVCNAEGFDTCKWCAAKL